jgi:hypothetical protein
MKNLRWNPVAGAALQTAYLLFISKCGLTKSYAGKFHGMYSWTPLYLWYQKNEKPLILPLLVRLKRNHRMRQRQMPLLDT